MTIDKVSGLLAPPNNKSFMETLAHLIELRPVNEDVEYLNRAIGTDRFVYNWGLAEWNRQYALGLKPSAKAIKKQFNAIKYEQFPWMKEIHRDAHAQPFANLGKAWSNFFRDLKKKSGRKSRPPKFKKKNKSRDSFYVANDKLAVDGRRVRLPIIGWIEMTESLRFGGRILGATVSKRNNRWFISFQCEFEVCWLEPKKRNKKAGIDVGISAFVTSSVTGKVEASKPLKKRLRRLRMLSRRRDKPKKSEKATARINRQIANLHFNISNVRKDFTQKLSTKLCRENQAIGYEDLKMQFMLSNRKLARAVSDLGLGDFFRQLEYKHRLFFTRLVKADQFFPSSKLCSITDCGYIFKGLTLKMRSWTCPKCGTLHDRDKNAAKNLENLIEEESQNTVGLHGNFKADQI